MITLEQQAKYKFTRPALEIEEYLHLWSPHILAPAGSKKSLVHFMHTLSVLSHTELILMTETLF
jgi:hypothetical protein